MSPAASRRTPAVEIASSLVAAGRRILEDQGPSGLTVRAVAAAAGVAPMGVYNHFAGKDGLLDAVVTDGFREFGTMIAATDDDPSARLRSSGAAYRAFALANPTLYSLMFGGMCRPDDAAAAAAFGALTEVIRYGQVGGIIRDGDPAAIAMQVWSCAHGAMGLELSGSVPDVGVDHAAKYENLMALVARGLAPDADPADSAQ